MADAEAFNTTLFDLITDLKDTIPSSAELQTAYHLFNTLKQANPRNTLGINGFWNVAKDHVDAIKRKDTEAMARVLRGLLPDPGVVDGIWDSLTDENRETVADYVEVLYNIASHAGTEEVAAPIQKSQQGPSDVMCLVYNNAWKELVKLLPKKIGLTTKVPKLLQTKGDSCDTIFAVVAPCLSSIIPGEGLDESMLMSMVTPPQDPVSYLSVDRAKIGSEPFPLDRNMTFNDFYDILLRDGRAVTYWHYIKVMTHVMLHCPPEVAGIMTQLINGGDFMSL